MNTILPCMITVLPLTVIGTFPSILTTRRVLMEHLSAKMIASFDEPSQETEDGSWKNARAPPSHAAPILLRRTEQSHLRVRGVMGRQSQSPATPDMNFQVMADSQQIRRARPMANSRPAKYVPESPVEPFRALQKALRFRHPVLYPGNTLSSLATMDTRSHKGIPPFFVIRVCIRLQRRQHVREFHVQR